jgi:hypothetical protein
MPDRGTVQRWMAADADFAAGCARARELGADVHAEAVIEIADTDPERLPTGAIDAASVADKKVRIAARQWFAAKVAPRVYGDKLTQEHTGAGGGPIQHQNIPADLSGLTDDELDTLERLSTKLGGNQAGAGST